MSYNITWSESANTLADIFVGVNQNSQGLFAIMLLVALYVIVLFAFQGNETRKVMLVDGFFVAIIGILMWAAGVFPMVYLSVPILLLIAGIMIYSLT